jgi:peptide deformylase
MLLELLQVGDPILREKARALSHEEIASERIQQLIHSMRETLHAAPGVGLAAPQIGESIQLAIVEDLAEYMKEVPQQDLAARQRRPVPFHVIINPSITSFGNEEVEFFEGCLSLAGFMAVVPPCSRNHPRMSRRAGQQADDSCIGLVCTHSAT